MIESISRESLSVGIVLNSKNHVAFLKRSIESVINQTYSNWLLVIISDDDSNSTEIILNRYANHLKGRFSIIRTNKNTSSSHASNLGLQQLNTEMAVILKDTDTWAPEFLSRMLAIYKVEKSNFPSVGGIVCQSYKVYEKIVGNIIAVNNLSDLNQHLKLGILPIEEVIKVDIIPASSFVFELATYHEIGFYDESISGKYAWDFHARYIQKVDIWMIAEGLAFVHYQVNENSNDDIDERNIHRSLIHNKWLRRDLKSGSFGIGSLIALSNLINSSDQKIQVKK